MRARTHTHYTPAHPPAPPDRRAGHRGRLAVYRRGEPCRLRCGQARGAARGDHRRVRAPPSACLHKPGCGCSAAGMVMLCLCVRARPARYQDVPTNEAALLKAVAHQVGTGHEARALAGHAVGRAAGQRAGQPECALVHARAVQGPRPPLPAACALLLPAALPPRTARTRVLCACHARAPAARGRSDRGRLHAVPAVRGRRDDGRGLRQPDQPRRAGGARARVCMADVPHVCAARQVAAAAGVRRMCCSWDMPTARTRVSACVLLHLRCMGPHAALCACLGRLATGAWASRAAASQVR